MNLHQMKSEIDEISRTSRSSEELQTRICQALSDREPKYNWVGFYIVDEHNPELLILDQYKGNSPAHKEIKIGEGICRAAALEGKTINVPDVSKDKRFLACSAETKSEIVVPVFAGRALAGDLDIDSNSLAAFSKEDEELLEYCAKALGDFLIDHGLKVSA